MTLVWRQSNLGAELTKRDYDTITETLYRPSLNSKHTALSLDLLSTGNSNTRELREVVAEAVNKQRVGKFRFKPSFPKDWWRVISSCPSTAVGCRADTDIICPGSQCRRADTRDTYLRFRFHFHFEYYLKQLFATRDFIILISERISSFVLSPCHSPELGSARSRSVMERRTVPDCRDRRSPGTRLKARPSQFNSVSQRKSYRCRMYYYHHYNYNNHNYHYHYHYNHYHYHYSYDYNIYYYSWSYNKRSN